MNVPPATVRYLILCEDVLTARDRPQKVTLVNLISAIRAPAGTQFPIRFPEFCVFVQLTECRGPAECHIEITQTSSGQRAFRTLPRTIPFPADPLEVHGLIFRIRNCRFAEPGHYSVALWYNGAVISEASFLVREASQ